MGMEELKPTAVHDEDLNEKLNNTLPAEELGVLSDEEMPELTELAPEERENNPQQLADAEAPVYNDEEEAAKKGSFDALEEQTLPIEENAHSEEAAEAVVAEENSPIAQAEEMYYLQFFSEDEKDKPYPNNSDNSEKEEEEKEQEPYNPEKPRRIDTRFDFIELFVFTLAIVMLITSFIFRHSIVEGPSMENTLFEGEHLIISDLFYTPEYGDIIVCQDYTTNIKTPIVKRVIALGGDRVKITKAGDIYINGELLLEGYVYIDDRGFEYKAIELTVPEGEIFVMGDHRNESTDSRDPHVGTISVDAVLGKVLLRIYPLDRFGRVD